MDKFGISVNNISIDIRKVVENKNSVVERLRNGVKYLLKANGVRLIEGTGTIVDQETVMVSEKNGSEIISTKNVIIATGSEPVGVPGIDIDRSSIITSDEALKLEEIPKNILIIGGGAIGVEFASIFNKLGVSVNLIEKMPTLLPGEDEEIVTLLRQLLEAEGINVITGVENIALKDTEAEKTVSVFTEKGETTLHAEKILIAAGRAPYIKDLGVDNIDIHIKDGGIVVNKKMMTNVPNIYAVGDVVGPPQLAHVAMAEGIAAAENAMGKNVTVDYQAVPRCLYTIPEIACVGLTENQAKERFKDIKIGKFPFSANGKAIVIGEVKGFVKVIADSAGKILGMHIIGPNATELISEGMLAIKLGATIEDVGSAIHAHPTLSEALKEAAFNANEKSIHIKP